MTKLLAALPFLLVLSTGCAFDEGVNAHDVSGTVYVPKSVAPTADDVGMIYIGLYSAVDMHLGYPSPAAAPSASTSGADTFPYGGTSIGVFTTRDTRSICQTVTERSIREDGNQWALDFEILQFPFHDNSVAWAWMDLYTGLANTYRSCDNENGYYGEYQLEVEATDVSASGTGFEVLLEDSDLPFEDDIPGYADDDDREEFIRYQDADGQRWGVNRLDSATDTLYLVDIYSNGGSPATSGPAPSLIISTADYLYYGSQRQDVLNFPGKYIDVGDFVSEDPFVLENTNSAIELTIAYERD